MVDKRTWISDVSGTTSEYRWSMSKPVLTAKILNALSWYGYHSTVHFVGVHSLWLGLWKPRSNLIVKPKHKLDTWTCLVSIFTAVDIFSILTNVLYKTNWQRIKNILLYIVNYKEMDIFRNNKRWGSCFYYVEKRLIIFQHIEHGFFFFR